MRASSISFNFKPRNILPKQFFAILTSALVAIATVASSVPSTVSADAVKRIDGTGPFQAGETVTVEFQVPRITSVQVDPVEIVFVVDASGSLAGAISTAKSQMNSFADWLAGYYGYAKVGVVSFGMDEDNSPGLRTHMSLRTIDDSSDVTAMHNAINSISARADGFGFSDIQKGLIRGNSLFTDPGTTAASGRHLVLLTDGLANYPASGSTGFGYPWNGVCPLHPSPERSSISGLRYSHFIIIPQGPTGNGIPAYAQWWGSTGLEYYIPPCASYIQTHHGGWLTGMGLIDNMIAHYPGIRRKESSMQTTIDFLQNVITPTTIRAHDTINSAVFTSIPDSGVVRNCSSGSIISGSNNTVGGTGLTIDTNMPYSSSVALYCVRFRATLNSPITSGTYEINRTAFNNWIRYYNVYGTIIGSDGIQGGSITISGNPDMAATEFWLTNSSGTQKRVFNRNESIYTHTQITNVGDSTMPGGFKTAYYKHASSSLAANTSSDIPMYITGHGALGSGGVREYDSYSSTFPSTTDPNGANTSGARPWTQSTAGNYNALVFTNYQAMSEAGFPTNNRRGLGYSVITPPSNLQTSNLLCHQTNLTWTAGSSNISGYDVQIIDTAALLAAILSGTPYDDYVTYDHSIPASPTTMSASNLKPSTLYSWVLTPKTGYGSGSSVSINFTTPACPTYTIDVGGPYAAEPGETQNIDVNISYTPNAATWNTYDARIDVRVVGINYNNESCAAYAPNGAPRLTALDDFSVRVSGNPSVASQVIGPSSYPFQVNFTASTTTNTNTGRYTICIGYFSPDSYITYRDVSAVHVNVELHPWIQIDRPAGFTSSMVGDVHSNATIDLSVPLNQYFFKNGTAGVVSAYGTSGNHISFASNRTTNVANKLWRIPSYAQQVKTEAFSNLVSLAESALDDPAAGIPSGSSSVPSTSNVTAHCATGGGVFSYTPGTGTLTRTTEINLSSQACNGKNLVYFIDGDLVHNANIIDDTNDATITFIVSGNIIVSPSVTRLDGVHIFGGSFRDGSVYDPETGGVDEPLVINGSLIGLATQSPLSTKGTFSQGTYSGLQRNLSFGASGNDNLPAERIAYQPKYLYLLREMLGSSSFTWSE